MRGISCQSFAYLDFLPFSYFHNFAYLGIRLRHFGILNGILGALIFSQLNIYTLFCVFQESGNGKLAFANKFGSITHTGGCIPNINLVASDFESSMSHSPS